MASDAYNWQQYYYNTCIVVNLYVIINSYIHGELGSKTNIVFEFITPIRVYLLLKHEP